MFMHARYANTSTLIMEPTTVADAAYCGGPGRA